jgi:hypothetical protein
MKATEIMHEIKTMDNGERIKLLSMLFDEYFDSRPPREVIERERIASAWGEDIEDE